MGADTRDPLAGAVERVLDALATGKDTVAPLARAREVADRDDRWRELAELYDQAVAGAASRNHALRLLRETGDLLRSHGADREAEQRYRRVLGLDPDDQLAPRSLASLYRESERWSDLAGLLEERAEALRADQGAERADALREAASLYLEELDRPRNATRALERLEKLGGASPDDLDRLAAIHELLESWRPAADTLERLAQRVRGTPRAGEARGRAAAIYHRKLQLPDKAIDAYRGLLAEAPGDLEASVALASLLERRQRWTEMVQVLADHEKRVATAAERGELLRRRAEVLIRHLGRTSEGAQLLRRAIELTPAGPSLPAELADAIRNHPDPAEALMLTDAHAVWLERNGDDHAALAVLLAEMARLRIALGDKPGARRALANATRRDPRCAAALGLIAELEREGDGRAYAEARLRQADALEDPEARVGALLEAGRALDEKVGDPAAACAALERCLEIAPGRSDVVAALIALYVKSGDADRADALIERQLAAGDARPDGERAQLATEAARLALSRGGADRFTAERRLVDALDARPDHLPALLLLTDLLGEDGRYQELASLTRSHLKHLGAASPADQAAVERRLAHALEELSDPDEAYRHLRRADQLARNDLLTKIALGEHCARAGRWREASLHLQRIAGHPDAPRHAAQVAAALVHAATAEIRLRRPQQAPDLYEAALALDPGCRPAVRALFEIELERGNSARAADLLEVDAAAAPPGPEQARRFEGLGDLVLQLGDPARAAGAFERAVGSLPDIKSAQRPLIEKLLAAQRAAGSQAGVGRALQLLASTADGLDGAGLLCEAAAMFQRAGDPLRARAAAEEAVALDPYNEEAIGLATELQAAAGDWDEICAGLGRALFRWEKLDGGGLTAAIAYAPLAPDDHPRRARRATLWTWLGEGRRARGDHAGALTAFQRAVAVSPGPASVAARRGLVDLLAGQPDQNALVRAQLEALLELDPDPRDLLRYARTALTGRRITRADSADSEIEVDFGEDPALVDARRTHLELSATLGAELTDEDRRFLAEHPAPTLAPDQAYPGCLRDPERAALVADPDDEPLAAILASLAPSAALLWPSASAAIAELGAGQVRGAPALSGGPAALLARVARALAAPDTVAFATSVPDAPDISVVCCFPPAVVFGPRLAAARADDLPPIGELRFLLGRAAELVQPARLPATGLPRRRFALLIAGLLRAFGRAGAVRGDFTDRELDSEATRLRRHLPLPLRGRLEEQLRRLAPGEVDPDRYRTACERAADRAGLLVAGEIPAAMRLAGARGDARHLVGLAAKDSYIRARGRLGFHRVRSRSA